MISVDDSLNIEEKISFPIYSTSWLFGISELRWFIYLWDSCFYERKRKKEKKEK